MPLVRSIARRHVGKGEELDDLVQVGAVGLLKASDRFDPSRGVTFASFATPVIDGEIRHHLRDQTPPVRIPRELEQIRIKLRRERAELESRLGRPPSRAELAEALGVEESDVERALIAENARDSVSISSDVQDTPTPADPQAATAIDDRVLLAASMQSLDERGRRIVFLRFHADMTERQIAQEVGLSQAHVSRLLKGALTKLREELAAGAGVADANITGDIGPQSARNSRGTKISHVGRTTRGAKTGKLTLADYLELPYSYEMCSERDGDRTQWTASVEELSGCVAHGDTPEQAVARLRPAMESWLESAIAEQREIPVPGKKQGSSRSADSYSGRFLVRMPRELHAQLASAAEQQQVSLNKLVTEALAAAVERGELRGSDATTSDSATSTGARRSGAAAGDRADSRRISARSIRLVLATNMVVVMLAGIVALVLLVIAIQRGV